MGQFGDLSDGFAGAAHFNYVMGIYTKISFVRTGQLVFYPQLILEKCFPQITGIWLGGR